MPDLQNFHVWIPYARIPTEILQRSVVQLVPRSLFRATVNHRSHLSQLRADHVLAELGFGTVSLSQGGYWADMLGYVSPQANHTQYPQGLLLAAGFKSRPDARLQFAVIKVNSPIRSEEISLEQFVIAAAREYEKKALIKTQREKQILFYQALPLPPTSRY